MHAPEYNLPTWTRLLRDVWRARLICVLVLMTNIAAANTIHPANSVATGFQPVESKSVATAFQPAESESVATGFQPVESSTPKEIYGEDYRQDLFEVSDPRIRAWARSVGGVVRRESLLDNKDGTFTLLERSKAIRFGPNGALFPCEDEPLVHQPWVAICTGFLVGESVMATAGHCIQGEDFDGLRLVFGWEMLDAATPVSTIPADQVYSFVEIVEFQKNAFEDHALIQLDRPVTVPGALPLEVRRTGGVAHNTPVGVIGHPLGLPLKVAFGERSRVTNTLLPFIFLANFDASGGNSGSPVLDQATGMVEGIYVSSMVRDFERDGDCWRVHRVPDLPGGQGVMRSTNFAAHIPDVDGPFKSPVICGAPGAGAGGAAGTVDRVLLAAVALLLLCARRARGRHGGAPG